MKKMYLMKGMAVLAMGLVAASCNKLDFSGQPEVSDEEALANAEMALGINIDPSQDWNMTQQATASVDVNMGNGKAYSVAIYSNNPILDGQGVVMAEGNVADGGHFSTNFTCPKGSTEFYIGLTDAKNYTIYKPAKLEDGVLKVAFGSTANNASRRSVTIGNDVYDEFTFPTAEELEAAFPTSIPTGAEEVADLTTTGKYNNEDYNYNDLWWIYSRNGEGYNYKVTKNDEVTIGGGWNNADENGYHYFNVYVNVTGNVTLKRQGSPHFNLYILKGNVTIDSNFGEMSGIISVAEGVTLNDQRNSIAANGGVRLYNRGTVNATNTWKYDIGNKSTIYNEGTFEAKGALSYSPGAGNTSYFYNIGDDCVLKAPSMTLNSTCNFITNGTVDITGETAVTQQGINWINNGHYTTGSMKFSANNGSFYNYCQLIVKDNCCFMDGSFNMMDNSYAEIGTAVVNNFHVVMGNNSGLNIKNGTAFGQQGNGIDQGFFAKDDEAVAYVRLGGVTKIPFHNTPSALQISGAHLTFSYEAMNFYEGCYLDLNSTYANANYWNQANEAQIEYQKGYDRTWKNNGAIEAAVSDADFAPIKEGECSATWEEGGTEKEKVYPIYSYAFEDTKKGDYDMNDVVLKVQRNSDDPTKVDIKLVAAGATLDLVIRLYEYDESASDKYGQNYITLSYNNETEIHKMWGVDAGTMVNTGAGANKAAFVVQQVDYADYDPSKLRLAIYSESQGEMRLAGSGQAPFGVVIPADWKWPKERVRITSAYNQKSATDQPEEDKDQSFETFASEMGKAELWYNYPTGSVMK